MKTLFVWGAGGVGKSHCALRLAARREGRVRVLTLDPSRRLFHLVGAPTVVATHEVTVAGKSFELIATDALHLFEELDKQNFSKPAVRLLYQQMVNGLKDFRNYLDLVQIGDEIHRKTCDLLIIDTPPFQEAVGLHRAIVHLQRFFETSLITWAMRIGDNSLMQGAMKRVFGLLHFFSGKGTAQTLFDFVTWLAHHSERFGRSAKSLNHLLASPHTESLCIIHPETSIAFLEVFRSAFPPHHKISFIMNRSLKAERFPERDDHFLREMRLWRRQEEDLEQWIQKAFGETAIERIPLALMGDDTPEEIEKFAQS